MSLVDRAFARLDVVLARFYGLEPPQQNRRIVYRTGQNSLESARGIPLFGGDPSGFGEDYITYKIPKPKPLDGPLPLEHRENISGHIRESSTPLMVLVEAYQDPATSPRRLDYESKTDQQPIPRGKSPVSVWDGVVRSGSQRHGFESSRPKEPTIGDGHAADLKHYEFDFST
jgi:hypothetical protein